jgi:ribosome assembly protein RRB1
MVKRQAEDAAGLPSSTSEARKNGARPTDETKASRDNGDQEMGEFEDEYEDEFESEDEIIEAGVDGRPDAEREAEEAAGQ